MSHRTAVIIGAGPAGLTAAYELLDKTDIKPIVFEETGQIGGISRTAVYKGNRIDIGGHRFFSKSDIVMQWWQNIMPIQGAPARDDIILGRRVNVQPEASLRELGASVSRTCKGPDPEKEDKALLVRNRLSRIFFTQKFFDYPVQFNKELIFNLGLTRMARIGFSYIHTRMFPRKIETSLEDFFINRFGRELYMTFFKDYTEKVWGVPCNQIKPEWGSQRVKGLSVTKTLLHAIKNSVQGDSSIDQKNVETSLIGQFLYPKLGPGQLWEEVANQIVNHGGELYLNHKVVGLTNSNGRITEAVIRNDQEGTETRKAGDFFFSTMPVREMIQALTDPPPQEVATVAKGLIYRDFLTVGLLVKRLKIKNRTRFKTVNGIVPDNWIYVQERNVRLGRIQIFNNWSPYLVANPDLVWLGLEYFCNEGDDIWSMGDSRLAEFAAGELADINVIERDAVVDGTVIRSPKTYPTYSGSYEKFDTVRSYIDSYENLFLVGRNGMHKYNNADHSMLTAMQAVRNIIDGQPRKDNIWSINTEEDYHEEK